MAYVLIQVFAQGLEVINENLACLDTLAAITERFQRRPLRLRWTIQLVTELVATADEEPSE